MTDQPYSATLTGNPFLFFETRMVAERILRDEDREAIASQVLQQNLFQYRSTKSLTKRTNAIFRRLEGAERPLLLRLISGTSADGRIIVLMLIARSDRLFREFLLEIIGEKRSGYAEALTDGDFSRFFAAKAELSAKVAAWQASGRKKLREVYIKILAESGMLGSTKDRTVRRPVLDEELRRLLLTFFGPELVRAVEG